MLVVANEFLDALPVRQLVKTGRGWRERMVAAEGERFVCVAGESADGCGRARKIGAMRKRAR